MNKKSQWILLGIILLGLYFLSRSIPFFWDSHIHSAHAQSFQFWSPPDVDFGHPPFYNFLLILFWLPFGPSLWSAHLLTFSLIIATIFVASKISIFQRAPLFLLFLEPIFLANVFQMSAELYLLLGYFICLYFIEQKKSIGLAFCLVLFAMGSLRGILLIPALILTYFVLYQNWRKAFFLSLPALVVSLCWLLLHYNNTGWFVIPPHAGSHRSAQDLNGFFKNVIVFIWYLGNHGRFILIASLGYLFLLNPSKERKKNLFIALIPLFLCAGFTLPFTNPFGERYLLIPNLLLLGCFWKWSHELNSTQKKWIRALTILALSTGHFWNYPTGIAQNWDSSLSYLIPIWHQNQFEDDFKKAQRNQKPYSFYPQTIPREYTHLNTAFEFESIDDCKGILSNYFFSPLQNGLSDATLQKLLNHSYRVKEYRWWTWRSYWLRDVPCAYFQNNGLN